MPPSTACSVALGLSLFLTEAEFREDNRLTARRLSDTVEEEHISEHGSALRVECDLHDSHGAIVVRAELTALMARQDFFTSWAVAAAV